MPPDSKYHRLAGKHLLLGVTGGIAAYKTVELIRRLKEHGASVRVILTAAGARFVPPLTLQAVSGHRVHQHLLDPDSEAAMGHIELARWADLLLVAPTTAHLMARLAHGLADDLLTTTCLASEAPVVLAPAMNRVMWQAEATRANRRLLQSRGVLILGPATGAQACGELGEGRMLEPETLLQQLARLWPAPRSAAPGLAGKRILITAGPTREAIDPVRFLSNRSSGKMGFALAEAAARAGARTLLVSGPVALSTPPGVERIDVLSADQMSRAVLARAAEYDVFIACAAVADYRPANPAKHKIKKHDGDLVLHLEPTPDILALVTALPRPPFTVGFAAETDALREHALDKLRRKHSDMIAANWVNRDGSGFEAESNSLEVFWPGGEARLGPDLKTRIAAQLLSLVATRLAEARPDPAPISAGSPP
jgi:phosphopantothenoylcysteine decarboxylase/phosphopantothenate--cysteine ligase